MTEIRDIFDGDVIEVWYDIENSGYNMHFIPNNTSFFFHYTSVFYDLQRCLEAWKRYEEYHGDHVSIYQIKEEGDIEIQLVFRYTGAIAITKEQSEIIRTNLEECVQTVIALDQKANMKRKWN